MGVLDSKNLVLEKCGVHSGVLINLGAALAFVLGFFRAGAMGKTVVGLLKDLGFCVEVVGEFEAPMCYKAVGVVGLSPLV
jgi:hypothetical protein